MTRAAYPVRKRKLADIDDDNHSKTTAADRLEMVEELTRTAWTFAGEQEAESRLRRDVGRVIRGRR